MQSGHHDFNELIKNFTPERRARVNKKKVELLAAVPLYELRKALSLTQEELAKVLKVNQPAVSKLESRQDVHISILRNYIEASLGGRLTIIAKFPQGDIPIDLLFQQQKIINPGDKTTSKQ